MSKKEKSPQKYIAHDSMVDGIRSLTFTRTRFDVNLLKVGEKQVVTISADGKVSVQVYRRTSKIGRMRLTSTDHFTVSEEDVTRLFEETIRLIRECTEVAESIDDATGEVKLTYFGGEVTVPRGLSKGSMSVERIIDSFVRRCYDKRMV